jgi:hypothetical protein
VAGIVLDGAGGVCASSRMVCEKKTEVAVKGSDCGLTRGIVSSLGLRNFMFL